MKTAFGMLTSSNFVTYSVQQAGSLEDFFVRHVVLPFNAKNGAQAALVKPLQKPDLLLIENPGLCTVQEGGNDDGPVFLDLCGKAERVTLPYFL